MWTNLKTNALSDYWKFELNLLPCEQRSLETNKNQMFQGNNEPILKIRWSTYVIA